MARNLHWICGLRKPHIVYHTYDGGYICYMKFVPYYGFGLTAIAAFESYKAEEFHYYEGKHHVS